MYITKSLEALWSMTSSWHVGINCTGNRRNALFTVYRNAVKRYDKYRYRLYKCIRDAHTVACTIISKGWHWQRLLLGKQLCDILATPGGWQKIQRSVIKFFEFNTQMCAQSAAGRTRVHIKFHWTHFMSRYTQPNCAAKGTNTNLETKEILMM